MALTEKSQNSEAHRISLIRSHILNRRFDDVTLRIIESVMASRDANSSEEVLSRLGEFVRSESMSILREGAEKPVYQMLLDLEFLVRAFALLGDVQSCLALRYEALTLREFKSASYQWLEVSHVEWFKFAEQSLEYGFHCIAIKACENALSSFQNNSRTNQVTEHFESEDIIEKIKTLKDWATSSAASQSVQAQTANYTKSKPLERNKACSSDCKRARFVASTLFRNGIRKRNLRHLCESQSSLRMTDEPNAREA